MHQSNATPGVKILYGVQATGNGHLSRARAMASALAARGVDVRYLFSGRDPSQLFAMQDFGGYLVRSGLSFVNEAGRIRYRKTLQSNRYLRFCRDVQSLDLGEYDVIVTDFEPVTAWAGRLRGRTVVSLGHQPAFDYAVPVADQNLASELVMRWFAPGQVRIGLHWARYAPLILPPLIHLPAQEPVRRAGKILVYLPFEDQSAVQSLLVRFHACDFFIYAPGLPFEDHGNLHLRPTSLSGFQADLQDCEGVICGAGFELASECLALGKRLLVKPQQRQMEQASNALALAELRLATCMPRLSREVIEAWLASNAFAPRIRYPDVASALADWLLAGDYASESLARLGDLLWQGVTPDCAVPLRVRPGAQPSPGWAA
ncbi:MAG: glycosyltransferase family protein [Chromatocurvus sp.]